MNAILMADPRKIDDWVNDWIGVPFKYDGRDKGGVDCYGLVFVFYRDVFGLSLPDWRKGNKGLKWVKETMSLEKDRMWIPLDMPQSPCIAFIERKIDRPHHMGIFWRTHIIHAQDKFGVQADHLSAFQYANGTPSFGIFDNG